MRKLLAILLFLPSVLLAQVPWRLIPNLRVDSLASATHSGRVVISDSAKVTGVLTVSGDLDVDGGDLRTSAATLNAFTSSTSVTAMNYGSTGAATIHTFNSNAAPSLQIYRNTNSSSASQGLSFQANNAASSRVEYARVAGQISANTTGLHSGNLLFYHMKSGTITNSWLIDTVGSLRPLVNNTYDIGTPTSYVDSAFIGDALFSGAVSVSSNIDLSTEGEIRNNQTLTTLNKHAFEDNTTLNITAEDLVSGYSGYDAFITINASERFNHTNGYQSRITYNGSDTLDNVAMYSATLTHAGTGNIGSVRGLTFSNPTVSGGGSITNIRAIYIGAMTSGSSTNYAIYSDGGDLYFQQATPTVANYGDANFTALTLLSPTQTTSERKTSILIGQSLASGGAMTLGFAQDTATPTNSWAWFGTAYGTNEATKSVVVNSSGNVGMGTKTPTRKLDVVGTFASSDTIRSGDYTTYTYFIPGGALVQSSDSSTKRNVKAPAINLQNFANVKPYVYQYKKQNFARTFDESSVEDSIDVQLNDSVTVRQSNVFQKNAIRDSVNAANDAWAEKMAGIEHSGFMAETFNRELFGRQSKEIRQEDVIAALWAKVQELEARILVLEKKP